MHACAEDVSCVVHKDKGRYRQGEGCLIRGAGGHEVPKYERWEAWSTSSDSLLLGCCVNYSPIMQCRVIRAGLSFPSFRRSYVPTTKIILSEIGLDSW